MIEDTQSTPDQAPQVPELETYCARCKDYRPTTLSIRPLGPTGLVAVLIHCPVCGLVSSSAGVVPVALMGVQAVPQPRMQPVVAQTMPPDPRQMNRADRRRMGLS